MLENKNTDMQRYVMLTQMEHFELFDNSTLSLAIAERKGISDKYPDFFSEGLKELRIRMSKGIRNRMNNVFRKVVETSMSDTDITKLRRYTYHIMEYDASPSKVLTVKLEI